MVEEPAEKTLDETILRIAREKKPETIRQLTELVGQVYPTVTKHEILETVSRLQDQGKLVFVAQQASTTGNAPHHEKRGATWYWLTLIVTLATIICVFAVPENSYPFSFIRYAFGLIFVLYLPGFACVKLLFPRDLPVKHLDENLETIARIAISLTMSLALVPMVGLLLNYTPWGIRLTPVTLGLASFTLTLATVALLRENRDSQKVTMEKLTHES